MIFIPEYLCCALYTLHKLADIHKSRYNFSNQQSSELDHRPRDRDPNAVFNILCNGVCIDLIYIRQ